MNKLNWIIPLLCATPALLQPVYAIESKSELEYAQQVLVRDTNKAITKKLATAATYLAELDNPALKQKALEEIREALLTLQDDPKAADAFVEGIKRMSQSGATKLQQLVQNKQVQAFAQAVMDESSSSLHGASESSLKKLIGLGDDGVDQAGKQALNTLNEIDEIVASKGKVPTQLTEKLTDAIKQLPPSRAQAARKLVADKLKGAWKPIREHIGTTVDAGFVLWDAYNIVVSEDSAEEKAAKATGTAVGYGIDVAGGLAIQALGGSAFLPGLVVSWSGGKVNELVTEIILLQHDRENAAMKERWADIELRMDMIRGMIKIDELIKQGELQKANAYLTNVQKFYFKHKMPGDGLYEKMQELEQNIDNAEHLTLANRIIAEARIPYQDSVHLVRQGRNLKLAQTYAEDAQQILQKSLGSYPELKAPLDKVKALQVLISKLIDNATPLGKIAVSGPDTVKAGEYATYEISANGGIPDYNPAGIEGLALPTGAFAYWQAPDEAGATTVTFKLKDNLGQTASVDKEITVVSDTPEAAANDTSVPSIELEGPQAVTLKLTDQDYAVVEHMFVYHYQGVEDDTVIAWDFGDDSEPYSYPAHHGNKQPDGEWRSSIMQKYGKTGVFHPVVRLLDGNGKELASSSIMINVKPVHLEYAPLPEGLIPEGD